MGTRLANHRASLSSDLGSLWDFLKVDRPDRRRSEPANPSNYEPIHTDIRSPARLARDLLQVVHETVFTKKFDDKPKLCPLVKEESDLTNSEDDDEEDVRERRIANLIDFFFTIVKSQRDERKGSSGSCFRSEETPTEEVTVNAYLPTKVNTELEQKMDTLMEFLATTGCMDKEEDVKKDEKKITLMEFLFGPDDRRPRNDNPVIEVEVNIESDNKSCTNLSESIENSKDISFIDETPCDEGGETLVDMLIKYMEDYSQEEKDAEPTKCFSMTTSLWEKSKSDITISRLETFSDISKTKSDSSLTRTCDTVIDRYEDLKSEKSPGSRRISETVVDLSYIKQDLEEIFEEALRKVYQIRKIDWPLPENDVMTEQEDIENFHAYTKPPVLQYIQYLPYSVELSDILEEDEPSSKEQLERKHSSQEERMYHIRIAAELLIKEIEEKIQDFPFAKADDDDSSEVSTEDFSREMDLSPSLKRSSISLIDLRHIPDLPPSMIVKPKVIKIDKATSTTEISDSTSDLSKRIDSACNTEDTSLSGSSGKSERALEKIDSLHKFFSKSRLEIIDESLEENGEKKIPKLVYLESQSTKTERINEDYKMGQASLDDVEDILEDNDFDKKEENEASTEGVNV